METILIKPSGTSARKGHLLAGDCVFPCALGRTGLTSQKREGDGATPILTTRPLFGFYRSDRGLKPISSVPFTALRADMGWCDATDHPSYNQMVKRPFTASHEEMWREDAIYDLVLVLDINISRRIKHRGSALFMHLARPDYTPTDGCIALKKRDFYRLLTHMHRQTRIIISR